MDGVVGIWVSREDHVAQLAYCALYALQHRGQGTAGIAIGDGHQLLVCKDAGLVSQVCSEPTLDCLAGHVAVAHVGGATTDRSFSAMQPVTRRTKHGILAVGLSGSLTNKGELGGTQRAPDDSRLVAELLAQGSPTLEERALEVLPRLKGSLGCVWTDQGRLFAARDRQGISPLVLGALEQGWIVASEGAALASTGARLIREVEPGELLILDGDGMRSYQFARPDRAGCVLEYVTQARPDAVIQGRSVHESRMELGRLLARYCPADADLVTPVPESGTPAALGYSAESHIPLQHSLVLNSYLSLGLSPAMSMGPA